MINVEMAHNNSEQGMRLFEEATEVHTEVYAEPLFAGHPFFSEEAFRKRYRSAVAQPGFDLLVAKLGQEIVGYVYGYSLTPPIHWWSKVNFTPRVESTLPTDYMDETGGGRTFVIPELIVRMPWRRQGIARQLHDSVLALRSEERAGLRVLPNNIPAKTAYSHWGWDKLGTVRPDPIAPVYDCMVKTLRMSSESDIERLSTTRIP